MLPIIRRVLPAAILLSLSLSHAGGFSGLIVKKIWVKDGKVVVSFDPVASDQTSIQSVRAAYTEGFTDYKSILAALMQAKAAGTPVNVYTGSGGMPLRSLIDASEPDYWATTISMVALE